MTRMASGEKEGGRDLDEGDGPLEDGAAVVLHVGGQPPAGEVALEQHVGLRVWVRPLGLRQLVRAVRRWGRASQRQTGGSVVGGSDYDGGGGAGVWIHAVTVIDGRHQVTGGGRGACQLTSEGGGSVVWPRELLAGFRELNLARPLRQGVKLRCQKKVGSESIARNKIHRSTDWA